MDADGHVHNAVHLRYLEETRIDLLNHIGFNGSTVVAQMDIEYLAPLVYRPSPVRVETWVTRVGGSSFGLAHELLDEHNTYVRAECNDGRLRPAGEPLTAARRARAHQARGAARVNHTYLIQLRRTDIDAFGHVNNVVYVNYLDEARADLLATHAPEGRPRPLNTTERAVLEKFEV